MFALPFFKRDQQALKGANVFLRAPALEDYADWAQLRGESRNFLEPWEPRWSPDELGRYAWRQRIRRYREEIEHGTGVTFLIFENATAALVGGISIGNIRRGVSQTGQVGYWMGARYAGQGMMTEALNLVTAFAFDTLRLHRVEAACIPGNERSVRVLEKAGFRREGLLRSYLRINGSWQDHYLYGLIADERRPRKERG